jgi:hypothetical protein
MAEARHLGGHLGAGVMVIIAQHQTDAVRLRCHRGAPIGLAGQV